MKILFDDLVFSSTLSATSAEGLYPVTNIRSPFVSELFKSTLADETITIEFDDDYTVDCIYISQTNATAIYLKLYDASDTLLLSKTVSNTYYSSSFTAVENCAYVTVEFVHSTDAIYVGKVSIGAAYDPGIYPYMPIDDGFDDDSIDDPSAAGGDFFTKFPKRKKIELNFSTTDINIYKEFYAHIADNEYLVFADVYDYDQSQMTPFVCRIDISDKKRYAINNTFTVTLKERF